MLHDLDAVLVDDLARLSQTGYSVAPFKDVGRQQGIRFGICVDR